MEDLATAEICRSQGMYINININIEIYFFLSSIVVFAGSTNPSIISCIQLSSSTMDETSSYSYRWNASLSRNRCPNTQRRSGQTTRNRKDSRTRYCKTYIREDTLPSQSRVLRVYEFVCLPLYCNEYCRCQVVSSLQQLPPLRTEEEIRGERN